MEYSLDKQPVRRDTTIAASKVVSDIVGPRRLAELIQRKDRNGLLFAALSRGQYLHGNPKFR